MEMLDTSLSNKNILDESFSNMTSSLAINPAITSTPMRPTSGNTAIQVSQTDFKPKPTSLVAPSVTSGAEPTQTVAPTQTASAIPQPIFLGGGSGSDMSEEQQDSSKRETASEKTIFGLKPIIAYGIGAAALAFVYFKFIK